MKPRILLFDEPSSALDPQNTKMLSNLMSDLCKNGVTIALSSHDMNLVSDVAHYVYYLENGQLTQTFDKTISNCGCGKRGLF